MVDYQRGQRRKDALGGLSGGCRFGWVEGRWQFLVLPTFFRFKSGFLFIFDDQKLKTQ